MTSCGSRYTSGPSIIGDPLCPRVALRAFSQRHATRVSGLIICREGLRIIVLVSLLRGFHDFSHSASHPYIPISPFNDFCTCISVCVCCLCVCIVCYVEVMETEQTRALSSAIQDLDNQIEEQKLKIQNTANSSLRVSVCVCGWVWV